MIKIFPSKIPLFLLVHIHPFYCIIYLLFFGDKLHERWVYTHSLPSHSSRFSDLFFLDQPLAFATVLNIITETVLILSFHESSCPGSLNLVATPHSHSFVSFLPSRLKYWFFFLGFYLEFLSFSLQIPPIFWWLMTVRFIPWNSELYFCNR